MFILRVRRVVTIRNAGHRIISTFTERMAAADPANSQPPSFENSVLLDRLQRVDRTTRCKTAVASEQPRQRYAVKPHRKHPDAPCQRNWLGRGNAVHTLAHL